MFAQADPQNDPAITVGAATAVVQTAGGHVRGYMHRNVYTFKGIPYGSAERFLLAYKPEPWEGIRNCLVYGPTCPTTQAPAFTEELEFAFQPNRGYHVDEQCLTLNIWVSHMDSQAKKPVMVWLHGGGFANGSAIEFPSHDGESLARNGDVVVVSLNHRLNVLGFLDLSAYSEKYQHAGNVGATDIVLALQWVQKNIANFGGDPGNVTIFGQSGGGSKVMCLLNAPSAKGLFHKAIVQSGSYPNHFTDKNISQKVAEALLAELELSPERVDALETMPYEQLAKAGTAALAKVQAGMKPDEVPTLGLEWNPVLDYHFLPYQIGSGAARALSAHIPLLVGSVKNEFVPFEIDLRKVTEESAQAMLLEKYGDQTGAYIAALKNAYPEIKEPSELIDVDMLFRPLVINHANEKFADGGAAVYTYLFKWQSPVLDRSLGAVHCMDLPFVFDNIALCEQMTGGGKDAYILAEKISLAWIHFARTGNPNHQTLPDWPAYNPETGAVMVFDNECIVKYHHDKALLRIAAGSKNLTAGKH
ncbi:carboxylesterase/lipase family protein [Dyadobacter fanqingshengii]|uniref:Carboxylic ester hydrolase n=1 Tax=Dyadobacter fanqingshengii TaxID=2906443 RepID=A0A9X1PCU0_9BACT|nr:carboxylesterase family protein [Dyadobacter fanqingshengii]MCF0041205.1 carboxylesterase family protein [Dyadobacter fanqingshengii]USJ37069.1 carboxylesterase family protein [Dyadobacter fanqingshengii]